MNLRSSESPPQIAPLDETIKEMCPPPLLHARLRPVDRTEQPAVPRPHGARAHPADVRRQEHDGRLRPQARSLPHSGCCVPWSDVDEGGGRTDAQYSEQELCILC